MRSAPRPVTVAVAVLTVTEFAAAGLATPLLPSRLRPPRANPTPPTTSGCGTGRRSRWVPAASAPGRAPAAGRRQPVSIVLPQAHSALGSSGPSDLAIRTDFAQRDHAGTLPPGSPRGRTRRGREWVRRS